MKRDSVNDPCYPCHMEKRGPFVHNHRPVSENCGICHDVHGTAQLRQVRATPYPTEDVGWIIEQTGPSGDIDFFYAALTYTF